MPEPRGTKKGDATVLCNHVPVDPPMAARKKRDGPPPEETTPDRQHMDKRHTLSAQGARTSSPLEREMSFPAGKTAATKVEHISHILHVHAAETATRGVGVCPVPSAVRGVSWARRHSDLQHQPPLHPLCPPSASLRRRSEMRSTAAASRSNVQTTARPCPRSHRLATLATTP